jgi:hypothetical protein
MARAVAAEGPAVVRVVTLLDALTRRSCSPAECDIHKRLQAEAEHSLLALLSALGELDEQPLRQAMLERSNSEATS